MYLLLFIGGLIIGALTSGTMTSIIIGGAVGIGIALLIHMLLKVMSDSSSKSVFDGCVLLIIIEGIFMGLGDI